MVFFTKLCSKSGFYGRKLSAVIDHQVQKWSFGMGKKMLESQRCRQPVVTVLSPLPFWDWPLCNASLKRNPVHSVALNWKDFQSLIHTEIFSFQETLSKSCSLWLHASFDTLWVQIDRLRYEVVFTILTIIIAKWRGVKLFSTNFENFLFKLQIESALVLCHLILFFETKPFGSKDAKKGASQM